ncbi:MAG: hypothetical protein NWE93_12935 [Candidatus Bathyarchaeota archaeon]|nr:hypothetical protein [Candidatus Bathyarchaeota archaeon]
MVLASVEGLEMQARQIPRRQLAAAWQKLSAKPLPKIKALQVSDADFNHVLAHRRCPEDDQREIEEWGHLLTVQGTDACVFCGEAADGADYVMLIRQSPYHSLQEIISHELAHIARGDL